MLDMLGITAEARGMPPHLGLTLVEAMIVLATWVNQSSPSADNALTMLGVSIALAWLCRFFWRDVL